MEKIVPKDRQIHIRISGTLKEKFDDALKKAGYDQTDFITMRIVEFVERMEVDKFCGKGVKP